MSDEEEKETFTTKTKLNKEKKSCNFIRTIKNDQNINEYSKNIQASIDLILYDEEIMIKIKIVQDDLNTNSYFCEKIFSESSLKSLSKFYSILDLPQIFESIKNIFEEKKDILSIHKDKINIKYKISINILEEEINLDIPLIKATNEDELKNLKNSVYFLNKEKNDLQEEITSIKNKENILNNTVKELQNELKDVYNYIKILKKDEEKEKEIKNYYCVREIKSDEKEENDDEEINNNEKPTPTPESVNMDTIAIYIYLYKEKIKIKINKIQDNLKSNPYTYESNFDIKDFQKISDYYIKFNGVETIYNFLCEIFEQGKDSIIKNEDDKIIIKIKFPCGLKEEEINFEILKKELSLENSINNLKQSVKYINKKMKNKKISDDKNSYEYKNEIEKLNNEIKYIKSEEYKNDMLKTFFDKIYPIGSYYWSEKNTSPEILFGGKWEQISGKFLFSVDANHAIGTSGGEEKHQLTIDEIPSHNHSYDRFHYDTYYYPPTSGSNYNFPCFNLGNSNFYANCTTSSVGSNRSHNNMPPYITAYCWKRYN